MREQKITEMIQRKGHLDTVYAQLALRKQRTRIVHEYIETVKVVVKLLCRLHDLGL